MHFHPTMGPLWNVRQHVADPMRLHADIGPRGFHASRPTGPPPGSPCNAGSGNGGKLPAHARDHLFAGHIFAGKDSKRSRTRTSRATARALLQRSSSRRRVTVPSGRAESSKYASKSVEPVLQSVLGFAGCPTSQPTSTADIANSAKPTYSGHSTGRGSHLPELCSLAPRFFLRMAGAASRPRTRRAADRATRSSAAWTVGILQFARGAVTDDRGAPRRRRLRSAACRSTEKHPAGDARIGERVVGLAEMSGCKAYIHDSGSDKPTPFNKIAACRETSPERETAVRPCGRG
jgi:hypothetical protein